MDITKKITSYEDACKELNLNPENLPVVGMLPEKDQKSIVAYYKLVIITRALNEGWEPDWTNCNQLKYYNWLDFSDAGLAYAHMTALSWSTDTSYGYQLCFKNLELAYYAGEAFKSLYEEYLFN